MPYKLMRFPNGKEKAVTLSYDDGCTHDLRFKKIIDEYGLKCTFNLNSSYIPEEKDDWRLSKKTLLDEFKNSPHEIAVHGAFHKAPGIVSSTEFIDDVLSCRKELERLFGRIVQGMAYPDSGITHIVPGSPDYLRIREYLQGLGILYARSLAGDNDKFDLPTDWYNWLPTAHHTNPELFSYLDAFLAPLPDYRARRTPRLFYLWGHSFEFANNDDWDLLERFCKKVAEKKEEIWFATNGEIYDYTTAYQRLVRSAEGSLVYNPTLLDVWFEYKGKTYCVRSGETLSVL